MVLTITVVGNGGQTNNNGSGHAVLSPNELAQLMSGQTVTGMLNPDGSITLNSNVMSSQQLTSVPATMQNGTPPTTSSSGSNYQPQLSTIPSYGTNNIQAISSDPNVPPANNLPQNPPTTQKKTGQKRLSAKQKLAQQLQQKNQQSQPVDSRPIMTPQTDQTMNQQPQIVATVQLPNGQIGQLIAPSGGQFWSPNAINLQQLSMAVAAATGTMPQTMTIPAGPSSQSVQQQIGTTNLQQSQQQQQQQQSIQTSGQIQQVSQPQQSPQSLNNSGQQQVMTTMQPNNHLGSMMGHQSQNQVWSGGPISLSQLSVLAQQGVVQLSPVQGMTNTGPNGQRVMELIPQTAIQGLLNQNGQPVQAIPLSSGTQFITQDPNDPNKWQIVPTGQHQTGLQTSSTNSVTNNGEVPRSGGPGQFINSPQNTIPNDSTASTQPQRKLKRLACTCPNCRDGDNSRSNGDKKKQHICHFPDCNKVYGKTSHLRAHLRWHSGERPYVCSWSFCGKKFTRSDELQRHRRTHTGEKRFQCSECLKRFMRSDHLSKHLKTHLSSKKNGTNQVQVNGLPTLVTSPHNPVKIEENMIDDLVLETHS